MGKFKKVNDSGTRQPFSTGSVRDSRDGKGRFDLVSPFALKRLAIHFENGANKYGERNWEKGQPISRYIDSAIRHLYIYIAGENTEDHLAAAMWNVHGAIHTEEMVEQGLLPKNLKDMPPIFKNIGSNKEENE